MVDGGVVAGLVGVAIFVVFVGYRIYKANQSKGEGGGGSSHGGGGGSRRKTHEK